MRILPKGLARASAAIAGLLLTSTAHAAEPDLIIEVGPDVFKHGGVITVYPIPTDPKA